MHAGLSQPWLDEIGSIYSSTERKAIEAAEILGEHLALPTFRLQALGENDRSATGFLPPAEFETVATEFFSNPGESVRGWERALDAQARILHAIQQIAANKQQARAVAVVSHGAVGTLLYCALAGNAISRRRDQPANGGGNYYAFELEPTRVLGWWSPIDASAA